MACVEVVSPASVSRSREEKRPGIRRGRIVRRQLTGEEHEYLVYLPEAGARQVLVTVHGISRNAREHVRLFRACADERRIALVAPVFPKRQFPRYQRLEGEPRPDLVLHCILAEVEEATGIPTERPFFFGFSGGGQFVHRYAMAYPERVTAAALGAPGWFTFPHPGRRYPFGLKEAAARIGTGFEPERFLRIPMAVFVGEHDVERAPSLNTRPRIDARQGANRIERGRRWTASMRKEAERRGLATPFAFEILPGADHSFSRCIKEGDLARRAFDFLLGSGTEELRSR